MAEEDLSHEQLWDDSDLVSSWDGALAEYQKYHSLAAQGKKVNIEDLQSIERDILIVKNLDKKRLAKSHDAAVKHSAETSTGAEVNGEAAPTTATPALPQQTSVPSNFAVPTQGGMPQALLETVQDQDLRNLIVSWYWSGYYTGLLEGKQKAYTNMQHDG